MGTYTKKLNLLKPAEDDFYNVTTQQSENWQKIDDWAKNTDDNKLDKGAVSVNYNTAKKIEDIIEGQQATIDLFEQNKLDKTDAWRIQPKELPSGTDLNNIIEPGFYVSSNGSNTINNKPNGVNGAFELTVTTIQFTNYATQLLKDYRNNNYYTRRYSLLVEHGNYWTPWHKIALEDEVVKKSGDTMTGALAIKTATWSEVQFNDVNNKRIGTVGADIAKKKTFLHDFESQAGIDIYTDGRTEIIANNLITTQKEVIDAINNSVSDKGLILNKQPDYFDTLTTTGHYCLSECEIYKGAYKWGNFVVYNNRDFVTQIYYPDNDTGAMIIRTLFGPRGTWNHWKVIGTTGAHVATLLNVGDTFTIPAEDCFAYRIDLYCSPGGLSSSVLVTHMNNHHLQAFVLYNAASPEIVVAYDHSTRTFRLQDKGHAVSNDGYADIYKIG